MKTFRCQGCSYIYESEEVLDKCPICGAPAKMMPELDAEIKEKIYNADVTNDIHMEIAELAANIVGLCEEGIDIDLDPMCMKVFEFQKNLAWQIKQAAKAELTNHVKKEKF